MTYNVFGRTLSLTQSVSQLETFSVVIIMIVKYTELVSQDERDQERSIPSLFVSAWRIGLVATAWRTSTKLPYVGPD